MIGDFAFICLFVSFFVLVLFFPVIGRWGMREREEFGRHVGDYSFKWMRTCASTFARATAFSSPCPPSFSLLFSTM